jgi:outer membrane protein assembly factor BamB
MHDLQTEVVDRQGRPLFTSEDPPRKHALEVYSGGEPPFITIAGDGLDPATGEKLWHINGAADDVRLQSWLVGNVMISNGADGLTGYDLRSGQPLWRTPAAADGFDAVTDGPHVLITDDVGGVDAFRIADGAQAWKTAGPDKGPLAIYATNAGLLSVTRTGIQLLRPTGPPAAVPSVTGTTDK